MRTCTRCDQTKPDTEFALAGTSNLDGTERRRSQCKTCMIEQRPHTPTPGVWRGPQAPYASHEVTNE